MKSTVAPNQITMDDQNGKPAPDVSPLTGEPETETVAAPRMRIPDLLQRPFDVRSVALTGLFILALFYTMYFARAVLLPVVLALLLSYLFRPIVRAMAKIGIRPSAGAALVLIAAVATIGYGVSFLSAPVSGWIEKAPYGLEQLQHKLLPLRKNMEQVAKAGGEIDKLTSPNDGAATPTVAVKQNRITDTLYGRGPEFAVSAVLLLILLYFLLAYDAIFLGKVLKLMPTLEDKKRALSIAHQIESHVSRYLLTITLINIGLGIVVGTAVGLLGLNNPVMWGVLVAVLNFVPYLGALTGIACMTIGAVLSYDSLGYAMLFPATYLFIATIEGNFVTPYVMGRSLTLNPVIILLSLTFWGWMWGIAGVILAVPILAAFKIFCAHIEEMEPVAEFLS
ncbi:MAG: AI-2E family transporter [Verrucomicrobiota bacterium]|nr:AI-2E family transporter [Verrucomicrobiota bacterium]